jgi:hypothetical protein
MDRTNNKWSNLREATASQNMANRVLPSETGLKGAYRVQKGETVRYKSIITKDGKRLHLGCFGTAEEAHAAYCAAATQLHGEFARAA